MVSQSLTSAQDGGEWLDSHPRRFTPGKETPVPIEQDGVWDPDSVWALCRRENVCLC
jgi:hypothetical protein